MQSHFTHLQNIDDIQVTGAEMQIGINPVGGVVFMQYVTSPATSAANVWNKKPTQDELPALRRLSDIMWGAWNRENSAIEKIKYFWVQGVGNTNTKSIIARALKEKGKGLEKWPGITLDMSEDGALAILGMFDSDPTHRFSQRPFWSGSVQLMPGHAIHSIST
jgi:hypothetical protein